MQIFSNGFSKHSQRRSCPVGKKRSLLLLAIEKNLVPNPIFSCYAFFSREYLVDQKQFCVSFPSSLLSFSRGGGARAILSTFYGLICPISRSKEERQISKRICQYLVSIFQRWGIIWIVYLSEMVDLQKFGYSRRKPAWLRGS